ncbi:hypothetical protein F4810DRAFT_638539 [Camillea tinctor]|nr:hypothetical protein F4810DRAFT_638539 [Camillea tinctor]
MASTAQSTSEELEGKQKFVQDFKEVETFCAAYNVRKPFHYRIGQFMLHIEPACRKVCDLQIKWEEPGSKTLLDTLSNESTKTLDRTKLHLHGILRIVIVQAIDIPENTWNWGSNSGCKWCEHWRITSQVLPYPKPYELWALAMPDSSRGFKLITLRGTLLLQDIVA